MWAQGRQLFKRRSSCITHEAARDSGYVPRVSRRSDANVVVAVPTRGRAGRVSSTPPTRLQIPLHASDCAAGLSVQVCAARSRTALFRPATGLSGTAPHNAPIYVHVLHPTSDSPVRDGGVPDARCRGCLHTRVGLSRAPRACSHGLVTGASRHRLITSPLEVNMFTCGTEAEPAGAASGGWCLTRYDFPLTANHTTNAVPLSSG